MSALIYRRAFGDALSLQLLLDRKLPQLQDVRRRIFVAERRSDTRRPDHFYKNYLAARLGDVAALHDLPWTVLSALSDRFIIRVNGRIGVRSETFADWYELLPMISPLAVIAAFLVKEGRGPPLGIDPRAFLEDQIGESALVRPYYPELEEMIRRDGLNEMHMHLNGSTELDVLWPDVVRLPEAYLAELDSARAKSGSPTLEFYDQLELGLTPFALYRRLRSTRRARALAAAALSQWVRRGRTSISMSELLAAMDGSVSDASCAETLGLPLSQRPIRRIFRGSPASPIIDEAAFLYSMFLALREPTGPAGVLGISLLLNMMMLYQVGRISVQQTDEVGFDQFQKYTLVGIRERLEKVYEERFRQLNVHRPYEILKHLEGRLAPKKDVRTFLELIDSIVSGYLKFRGCPQQSAARGLRGPAPGCLTGRCAGACKGAASGRKDSELSLVVHFIKRRTHEVRGRSQALDLGLRTDLRQQAQVIRQVVGRYQIVRQLLRGVDAASNELHAAPEVFSASFRYLRREGISRATFHVGEDFVHLISGIRACVEAVSFLDLTSGDRIGHAIALGIQAELWLQRTGPRLMIAVGEHLDNLVFAHSVLGPRSEWTYVARGLESAISQLSAQVFGYEKSPHLLHRAWQLRGLDVLEVLELERDGYVKDIAEAAEEKSGRVTSVDRKVELSRIAQAARKSPEAFELFRFRHKRSAYLSRLTEIDASWLPPDALTCLQNDGLSRVAQAGVAIETLPTSNLRISAYDRLEEHHLFRWLNLTDTPFENTPAICVGSDDTGIFATSLPNEYAAVYDVLRRKFNLTPEAAAALLVRLNGNGQSYRFAPEPS